MSNCASRPVGNPWACFLQHTKQRTLWLILAHDAAQARLLSAAAEVASWCGGSDTHACIITASWSAGNTVGTAVAACRLVISCQCKIICRQAPMSAPNYKGCHCQQCHGHSRNHRCILNAASNSRWCRKQFGRHPGCQLETNASPVTYGHMTWPNGQQQEVQSGHLLARAFLQMRGHICCNLAGLLCSRKGRQHSLGS